MAAFDPEVIRKYSVALGRSGGSNPLDTFGMAFGVPDCVLNLTKDILKLLPSEFLGPLSESVSEAKDMAEDSIAGVQKKILMETGLLETDTNNGSFTLVSDSSNNKLDSNSSKSTGLMGKILNWSTDIGAGVTDLLTQYDRAYSASACLKNFAAIYNSKKGSSSLSGGKTPEEVFDAYALELQKMQDAQNFVDQANKLLADIGSVMADRFRNPALEPNFIQDVLDGTSGVTTTPTELEPVFRLVFGPPRSKSGQFLFSVDGLYYDSQSGGIPEVSGSVSIPEKYKFRYDANLGGKGEMISLEDLNRYVDTIFDADVVDDSLDLKRHYDADHFLQVLIGQKFRHLDTISKKVNDLIAQGYSEDSAMVINTKQQLQSVAAQHNKKINKRKKQIEVAVKAPLITGSPRNFDFGEIPINDFSYLSNLNLSVAYENQRKLIFRQAEVSGVVLPLQPKFVKPAEGQSVVSLDHLVVPPVGAGSITYGGEGTEGSILSLTDSVVTDGLIAIYNFLESEVTTPGSDVYTVLNCAAKTNKEKAAQLYANQPSEVFTSGLAIPYLNGMVTFDNATSARNGLGSVIKLPEISEYQDLFYKQDGCTVDFWVHMPNLLTSTLNIQNGSYWGLSTLHRVVFACENTGGDNKNENAAFAQVNYDVDTVRGLVCGFTRDRQIVSNLTPSSDSAANPVSASSIHFYIAPTRSINGSDVAFIRDTVTVDCASPTYKTLKCSVPLDYAVSGKKFGDASGAFMHVAVVTAPKDNQVKIYLDGILMTTSSIPEVFGVDPFTAPRLPSFAQSNSFEYTLSSTGLAIFADGPTVSSFTPWIIGGGYTDGAASLGGFMGQDSGIESGLKGHVGSFKFYSRALNNDEVLYNYNNQSPFFKNIQI
jgi:hypothetical protein